MDGVRVSCPQPMFLFIYFAWDAYEMIIFCRNSLHIFIKTSQHAQHIPCVESDSIRYTFRLSGLYAYAYQTSGCSCHNFFTNIRSYMGVPNEMVLSPQYRYNARIVWTCIQLFTRPIIRRMYETFKMITVSRFCKKLTRKAFSGNNIR